MILLFGYVVGLFGCLFVLWICYFVGLLFVSCFLTWFGARVLVGFAALVVLLFYFGCCVYEFALLFL